MIKQPELFLEHILMAILSIEKYIKGYNKTKFLADPKTIDAVIRQFEIIGEAAGNVPDNLTSGSPIPWRRLVGLRNKLIHDYMGVDFDIVWETAKNGLTPLKKFVQLKLRKKGKYDY